MSIHNSLEPITSDLSSVVLELLPEERPQILKGTVLTLIKTTEQAITNSRKLNHSKKEELLKRCLKITHTVYTILSKQPELETTVIDLSSSVSLGWFAWGWQGVKKGATGIAGFTAHCISAAAIKGADVAVRGVLWYGVSKDILSKSAEDLGLQEEEFRQLNTAIPRFVESLSALLAPGKHETIPEFASPLFSYDEKTSTWVPTLMGRVFCDLLPQGADHTQLCDTLKALVYTLLFSLKDKAKTKFSMSESLASEIKKALESFTKKEPLNLQPLAPELTEYILSLCFQNKIAGPFLYIVKKLIQGYVGKLLQDIEKIQTQEEKTPPPQKTLPAPATPGRFSEQTLVGLLEGSQFPINALKTAITGTIIDGLFPDDAALLTKQGQKGEPVDRLVSGTLEDIKKILEDYSKEDSTEPPPFPIAALFSKDAKGVYHRSTLGNFLFFLLQNDFARRKVTNYLHAATFTLVHNAEEALRSGKLVNLQAITAKEIVKAAVPDALKDIPLPPFMESLRPVLVQLATTRLPDVVMPLLEKTTPPSSGQQKTPNVFLKPLLARSYDLLPSLGATVIRSIVTESERVKMDQRIKTEKNTLLQSGLSQGAVTYLEELIDHLFDFVKKEFANTDPQHTPPAFLALFFETDASGGCKCQLNVLGKVLQGLLQNDADKALCIAFIKSNIFVILSHLCQGDIGKLPDNLKIVLSYIERGLAQKPDQEISPQDKKAVREAFRALLPTIDRFELGCISGAWREKIDGLLSPSLGAIAAKGLTLLQKQIPTLLESLVTPTIEATKKPDWEPDEQWKSSRGRRYSAEEKELLTTALINVIKIQFPLSNTMESFCKSILRPVVGFTDLSPGAILNKMLAALKQSAFSFEKLSQKSEEVPEKRTPRINWQSATSQEYLAALMNVQKQAIIHKIQQLSLREKGALKTWFELVFLLIKISIAGLIVRLLGKGELMAIGMKTFSNHVDRLKRTFTEESPSQ